MLYITVTLPSLGNVPMLGVGWLHHYVSTITRSANVKAHGGSSIAGLHDGERREAVAERSHGTTLSSLGYVSVRWADLS